MRTKIACLVLALVTGACGAQAEPTGAGSPSERECKVGGGNAVIDYVDFVKLGGTMFTHNYPQKNRISEVDLGEPIGEVLCKLSDVVTDPNYQPQNGDAGYIEPGTTIYAVKGYDPSFRVAAQGMERRGLTLYEADTVPDAKVGRDLLDIEGKVRYIGINSHSDGTTEVARIDALDEVERLVAMVLEAPVQQDNEIPGEKGEVIIEFHLEDGTSVLRNFFPKGPMMMRGIKVPQAFADAIDAALKDRG